MNLLGADGLTSSGSQSAVRTEKYLKYSTVGGYFMQDDPDTTPDTFDFVGRVIERFTGANITTQLQHNFGLIEQDFDEESSVSDRKDDTTLWQRFADKLERMNRAAPPTISYKLLFLGRHGQGFHNVAEAYYGTDAWNCYYSTLDGSPNGSMIWADAHLTKLGIKQAEEIHQFWIKQIRDQRMPTPESYYVSPLDRAIDTANHTFTGLELNNRSFKPIVKELLREGNGIHTCDRRATRSSIAKRWPGYTIEDGFTEQDELWIPDLRESASAHTARLRNLLDDIFEHDQSSWISMTTHSGSIAAILRAIGHRDFPLPTGGVLPVLVKVEQCEGKRPEQEIDPWEPKPDCKDDPFSVGLNGVASLESYLGTLDRTVE